MPLELMTIPCLRDNYAFLVHDPETMRTVCIDVPETGPILAVLAARRWDLTHILITHHDFDHAQGVPKLQAATGAKVVGAKADAHRLPPLDILAEEGDTIEACGETIHVLEVPGHTVGHIAFHFPTSGFVFTGDSLMSAGCGRLFEGTPEQMWDSLQKLSALPGDTLVCSGHEYTEGNLRFAATLEPENPDLILRIETVTADRAENRPSVPSKLADEMATNPFLRADLPALRAAVGMPDAPAAKVFAEIRQRKDNF